MCCLLSMQVAELERQQAALEEAMGELGATRSRISVIERELMVGGVVFPS